MHNIYPCTLICWIKVGDGAYSTSDLTAADVDLSRPQSSDEKVANLPDNNDTPRVAKKRTIFKNRAETGGQPGGLKLTPTKGTFLSRLSSRLSN